MPEYGATLKMKANVNFKITIKKKERTMNAEILKSTIETIVFLLPVLVLVWKGAKLTARLEILEVSVKDKTDAIEKSIKDETEKLEASIKEKEEVFCKKNALLQDKLEQERIATDSSIGAIMATLTEIQKSIVRVETKLDIGEQKK